MVKCGHSFRFIAYLQESVEQVRDAMCDLPEQPAAIFWTMNALHGLFLGSTWSLDLSAIQTTQLQMSNVLPLLCTLPALPVLVINRDES